MSQFLNDESYSIEKQLRVLITERDREIQKLKRQLRKYQLVEQRKQKAKDNLKVIHKEQAS